MCPLNTHFEHINKCTHALNLFSDQLTQSLSARQQFSYSKFVNEVDHDLPERKYPSTLPKSITDVGANRKPQTNDKSSSVAQSDENLLIDFGDGSELSTALKKTVPNTLSLFDSLTLTDNCEQLDRPLIQDVDTPIDPFDTKFSLRSNYNVKPSPVTPQTATTPGEKHKPDHVTAPFSLPEKTHPLHYGQVSESFENKRHQIEEKLGNNPLHQFRTNELNVGTYLSGSQIHVVNNAPVEDKKLYSKVNNKTTDKAFDWLNDAMSDFGVSKNKTYSNVAGPPLYDEVPNEEECSTADEKLQRIHNSLNNCSSSSRSSRPLYDEVPDEVETGDVKSFFPPSVCTLPSSTKSNANPFYAPPSAVSDDEWDSFDSDFDDEEEEVGAVVGATARLMKSDHLEKPPPLPPRDYLSNSLDSRRDALKKRNEKARIFPVLQDGKQMSSTHYFLIPPKGCDNNHTNTAAVRPFSVDGNQLDHRKQRPHTVSEYQNVSDVEYANNKCLGKSQLENGDRLSWSGMTGLKSVGRLSNDLGKSKPNNRTVPRSVPNSAKSVEPNFLSSSPRDKVLLVQKNVLGVTDEECHAALCQTSWDEREAMKYLKTEQLFRLGLTTRENCEQLLEALNWNLELASSVLLDEFRSQGKSVESTV